LPLNYQAKRPPRQDLNPRTVGIPESVDPKTQFLESVLSNNLSFVLKFMSGRLYRLPTLARYEGQELNLQAPFLTETYFVLVPILPKM
jgi:hypothetical protein